MCERETDYARGEAQRREEETEIIMKEVGYQIHATAHEVVDIFMGEAKMKQTRCRPTLTEMRFIIYLFIYFSFSLLSYHLILSYLILSYLILSYFILSYLI